MCRRCLILILLLLGVLSARSQHTYREMARDTIISKPGFLGPLYLLDGKVLNLSVMDFFMAEHPDAAGQIRVAQVTDQLSVACYGLGSFILLSGILVSESNPSASRDLLLYGAIGVGSGLLFNLFSNNHQRKAVEFYNRDVKAGYGEIPSALLYYGASVNGLGVGIRF